MMAGAAAMLSGCGFHPVYGTRGAAPGSPALELATVDVALIPERHGQLLRQQLQQRFEGTGLALAKKYQLTVSFGIASDAISIQQDTTATRVRQVATANWSLKRLDPASSFVTSGTARALDGFNILDQQYFAADEEGQSGFRRLAEAVANQITLQLATYFQRQATSARG
jgi:LPS-assembly lipoprotein